MSYTKEEYKKISQTKKDIFNDIKNLNIETDNNFKRRISICLAPDITFGSIITNCNKKRIKAYLEYHRNKERYQELIREERIYSYYIDITMLAIINSYYQRTLPYKKLAHIRNGIENKYMIDIPLGIDFSDLHNYNYTLQKFSEILTNNGEKDDLYFIDAYTLGIIITNRLKDGEGNIDQSIINDITTNYLEANTIYEKTKSYGKRVKPKHYQKAKIKYEYLYE